MLYGHQPHVFPKPKLIQRLGSGDSAIAGISRRRARGFSLIELLVAVAVVAILATLALAVIGNVRRQALKSQSYQNLRQLSAALLLYTSEYKGTFPSLFEDGMYTWSWDLQILPYLGVEDGYSGSPTAPMLGRGLELSVFHCPLDPRRSNPGEGYYPRSYGPPGVMVNQPGGDFSGGIPGREIGEGLSLLQIPNPARFVMLSRMERGFEIPDNTVGAIGYSLTNGPNPIEPDTAQAVRDWAIFDGLTPYVFADGHLEMLTPAQAAPMWPYWWNINR